METENVIGVILLLVIAIIIGDGVREIINDSHKRDVKCAAEHHGKPYSTEQDLGKTSDGCTVKKVKFYNSECYSYDHVYVTNCASACWDRRSGKFTHRECNTK